jgi:hypothetical protein
VFSRKRGHKLNGKEERTHQGSETAHKIPGS